MALLPRAFSRGPRAQTAFRAAALASLIVCSCGTPSPAALVLSLNTNDLAISADTDLVGLYVSQIGENGAVLRVDAHEAAPLRVGDDVKVPFPASLVLVPGEEQTAIVHVRLVAYDNREARTVITMRESRTRAPTPDDGARLLRLDLFFTNQGNVVDATPGAALGATASGLDTRSSDVASRDYVGAMAQQDFDRFTSICDGGPAPAGMTAGPDGRCTALEVELKSLPEFDLDQKVPGAIQDDFCYDVARAFDEDAAGVAPIARVEKSALASSGECRIALPARYDAATLNVALLTPRSAFPLANGKSVRPLAAKLAFSLSDDGATLTLPPNVCALARRDDMEALLLSPRTDAWGGVEPVCALWVNAKARHSFDKPAATPLGDAGAPDADAGAADAASDAPDTGASLDFADYAVTMTDPLTAMAAMDGRVLLVSDNDGSYSGTTMPEAAFTTPTAAPAPVALGGGYSRLLARAMRYQTAPAFFVYDLMGSKVGRLEGDVLTPLSTPSTNTYIPMPLDNGVAAFGFLEGPPTGTRQLRITKLVGSTLLSSTYAYDFSVPMAAASFGIDQSFGVFSALGLVVPNAEQNNVLVCAGSACTNTVLESPNLYSFLGITTASGAAVGLYRTDVGVRFYDYATGVASAERFDISPGGRIVSGGGIHCVHQAIDAGPDGVTCFDDAAISTSKAAFDVLTGVDYALLDGDDLYLYVAYKCTGLATDPVHVARMPWAKVAVDKTAFVNRCLP